MALNMPRHVASSDILEKDTDGAMMLLMAAIADVLVFVSFYVPTLTRPLEQLDQNTWVLGAN